jgi:hypothetical protein
VRYSVESDGTAPNSIGCARSRSMSEHASPPLDVRARLATASQHQHRVHQHLAAIVQPEPGSGDPRRQQLAHPEPISERPQSMQPDMSDDLFAAPFHDHRNRAVTVHLASALLTREPDASTTSESLVRRALSRIRPVTPRADLNDRG